MLTVFHDCQAKAAGEAWNAALARARGEKVLDDPTRLRRSLKKESKAAAKRGAAWAERTSAQQQSQAERQKRCGSAPLCFVSPMHHVCLQAETATRS